MRPTASSTSPNGAMRATVVVEVGTDQHPPPFDEFEGLQSGATRIGVDRLEPTGTQAANLQRPGARQRLPALARQHRTPPPAKGLKLAAVNV
jgi:hypothetical protein